MNNQLDRLRKEVETELMDHILPFWMNMKDEQNGGFYGQINSKNELVKESPKGGVLNNRILWTFSAAYRITGKEEYLLYAQRAKDYILTHFIDRVYGGVYWKVDAKGAPIESKKQIYNLGFAIYGLSEYYKVTNDEIVLNEAINLFNLIEKYSFDSIENGYFEAFTENWQAIGDMRLSDKDANEKKTMNTHLHILEPYTNLYRVWKSPDLKHQIHNLIRIFLDQILDKETHHLGLFFDEKWTNKSTLISYGHDIEAAWLIREAAVVIGDELLLNEVESKMLQIVDAALEGYLSDGSLAYELDTKTSHLDRERHWWVQAEAVVGAFDAYEVSGDPKYLDVVLRTWEYIKTSIIDTAYGEWVWSRMPDGTIHPTQDKAGFWKCPYHNSRMCFEIISRLS